MKITDFLQNTANIAYSFLPQVRPTAEKALSCKIVAHRGAWNNKSILENTMPAFQKAIDAGVWAIEFDIRWSKDNVPMIHHDKSAQRVFNNSLIIEDNLFSKIRSELPLIPRFEELLSQFSGHVHFMIELKEELTSEQDKILYDLLKDLEPSKDYHFMSLKLSHFTKLKSFPCETFVAIGRGDLKQVHEQSLKMNLGALTGHYLLFNNEMRKVQHNLLRKTGVGFPNSKNGLYREINRGFEWIFTNNSVRLQKELQSLTN